MSSFKLERGISAKQQSVQAGALLLILGIVMLFVWYPSFGIIMILCGLTAMLAGKFASS